MSAAGRRGRHWTVGTGHWALAVPDLVVGSDGPSQAWRLTQDHSPSTGQETRSGTALPLAAV